MFAAPVQQWLSVTWIAVLPCATWRRVASWKVYSASISVPAWFAMRVASVPSAAGHEDQRNRRRHQRRHEASNDPPVSGGDHRFAWVPEAARTAYAGIPG